MTKKQLLKLAGGIRGAALLLGISTQAIAKWGDKVPPLRIMQLHALRPEWFVKPKGKRND